MTTVIWREWYSPEAVESLTKMGTLPREVAEVFLGPSDDGADVARAIVELIQDKGDGEMFRDGGRLVILEPPELAGVYVITVDYTPTYYAHKASQQ